LPIEEEFTRMAEQGGTGVPWRVQAAVYGMGLFSTSIFYVGAVIIPLWAYTLDPSPWVFGVVFAMPHVLPLFLSIHGGALMDRLGARQVMLFCTALGAAVPLLYPLAPSIAVLIGLQMLLGFSESMGWIGAQTMIGQYMHGRTVYAGRLSAIIRVSQLAAPPMAGAAWDLAGPWGGFGMMSLWASGAVACALWLPALERPEGERPAAVRAPLAARQLLPSLADYATAFQLLRAPAVVIIVLLGSLMHVGNVLQGSFYVAWLSEMGITGTAIGLLSPAAAIGAALFSLVTTRLMRYVGGLWIVLLSLWIGMLLIAVTPLLGSYLLLQIAMFLRSGANGLAQPLIITLVLRGAGRANQGKAIGLRGTANRIASIAAPLAMGLMAEAVGLANAFYLVGAAITSVMIGIAIYLWRHPDIANAGEE
jgi:MFS family permease